MNKIFMLAAIFLAVTISRMEAAGRTNTLQVAAGEYHTLALRSDGTVWATGTNANGTLGVVGITSSSYPVRVPGLSNIVSIASGVSSCYAVGSNGLLYAWGVNSNYHLGDGTTTLHTNPVQVSTISNVVAVAAGLDHALALTRNGEVYGWGDSSYGQAGSGSSPLHQPTKINSLSNVVSISAGYYNSLARTTAGEVWAWGDGSLGGLGGGSQSATATPTKISALSGVVQTASARYSGYALDTNGKVWAWGYDSDGQLGNGTPGGPQAAAMVTGLSNIVEIAAGYVSAVAKDQTGKVWVWGFNNQAVTTPTAFQTTESLAGFTRGRYHSAAINKLGEVWTWGRNDAGPLGTIGLPGLYYVTEPIVAFSPNPHAVMNRLNRGDIYGLLNLSSSVIPLEFEKGIGLTTAGYESYSYAGTQPWFLRITHQPVLQPLTQTTGTTNLVRFATDNPIMAFGAETALTPLYTGRPYTIGAYAGGYDESDDNGTNAIRISVYSRSSFASGATNVSPTATYYINIPRRTVAADSNLWINFVTNGLSKAVSSNGLTTRLELVEGRSDSILPWGLQYATNASGVPVHPTNYFLFGLRLTHTGTDTNSFYRVDVKGKIQVATNTFAYFATNSAGQWDYAPLYALDFSAEPVQRALLADRPLFEGLPLPPPYLDKNLGTTATVTNTFTLSSTTYTNLDNSPELRRHPILDDFVEKMGRDPLALTTYVINEIGLVDPLAKADLNTTIKASANAGGVNRSALGTFLEGQGSPVEQCALLVYLLRQAGYPAAYVFPTNHNVRLKDTRLSRLWQIQVRGVTYATGVPVLTNSLVSVGYPWVTATIGGNTINIMPWLKDTEIVEGENLYDFMPSGYETASKWINEYVQGKTNILSLDPENNNPLSLFPKFIAQQLAAYPAAKGLDLDSIGMRVFDRRNQYPTWAHLPKPDYVTNLSQVSLVGSLSDSTNTFPFLANIFDTVRVSVYRSSVSPSNLLLTSGDWYACELNNRKLLLYTNAANSLTLWLAPYHSGITSTNNFSGGSGSAKQTTNTTLLVGDNALAVQVAHTRRIARLTSPTAPIDMSEMLGFTNTATCKKADIVGIPINFGRVTPAMERLHAEDYWAVQRVRATNNSYAPPIPDSQGTAAYLLGLSYFDKVSRFEAMAQQWHKVRGLMNFRAGLGIVGSTGDPTEFQPVVDMPFASEVVLGNGSLRYDSGEAFDDVLGPLSELIITGNSALEHSTINSTFPSRNAVSTVRLLQLATLRATNGNSGILILTKKDYQTKGDQAYTGYGAGQLKNADAQIWSSITAAFGLPEGDKVRVYVTPGVVTNESLSYAGVGALILAREYQSALISGNQLPLSGGAGDVLPTLKPAGTSPTLPYQLAFDFQTQLRFIFGDAVAGAFNSAYSPQDALYLDDYSTIQLTPYQQQQATITAGSLNLLSQTTIALYQIGLNFGDYGGSKAWFRNDGEPVFDPVSVLSGEFYIDTADLTLPGPLPIEIRRNYLSRSLISGSLGYGWKLGFTPHLVVFTKNSQDYIQAADPDGAVIVYRPVGTDSWKVFPEDNPTLSNDSQAGKGAVFNAFNGRIDRYTTNGTLYVVSTPNGHKRQYKVSSDFGLTGGGNTLDRTRPYLQRWEDHAGNYHTFTYGTNATANDYGQLTRIESANGNFASFSYDFYGRVIEAFTGDGRRVTYSYDGYGDLIAVTLPDNSQWKYEYQHYSFNQTNGATVTTNLDSNHLITRETKPNGRLLANYYDTLRRVTHQAATVGTNYNLITNAWFYYTNNCDSLTNAYLSGTTRVEDVFHNPTVYSYTSNFITRIVDPLNRTNEQNWYDYTESNQFGFYPRSVQFTVDPRGLTNRFHYDTNGNITTNIVYGDLTGSGVLTETATNIYTYTTNQLVATAKDPAGTSVEFYYEEAGDPFLLSRQIRKAGATSLATNTFAYTNVSEVVNSRTNRAFGLAWRTLRAGGATNDTYFDGRGFPTMTVAYPATAETASSDLPVTNYVAYNARGQVYQVTDALGGSTTVDYDAMGRIKSKEVWSETGESLSREFFYYNRNGELEWYDGPRSNPDDLVWNAYDGAGRKITEQRWRSQGRADGDGVEAVPGDALFAGSYWEYDAFGNLLRATNPRGTVTTNTWDSIGRLLTRTVREANGSLLATELYSYEAGGQVYRQTNALGGVTETLYNSKGSPRYRLLPTGVTNGWTYYLDGRPKREFLSSGAYWETTYDDASRRATKIFYSAASVALSTNLVEFDRRGNTAITIDAAGFGSTNRYDGLDRVKSWVGPTMTYEAPEGAPPSPGGGLAGVQQAFTNFYGVASRAMTNVNALGEKAISYRDALGRTTRTEIRTSANVLVRESSMTYAADHNSVTVTQGSGNTAIVSTSYTDTYGKEVLGLSYPASGVKHFTLNDYDAAGNLTFMGRYARTNSLQTQFSTASMAYDGMNRVTQKTDRDGAFSSYSYDAGGNVTEQVMPGGLIWRAAYTSGGLMTTNWNQNGSGDVVRANGYAYFGSGHPWAGLRYSHTDARSVVCTNYYDDWLRVSTNAYNGSLDEQKLTTSWNYDVRGLATNIVEQFASTATGPTVFIVRAYNAYGQVVNESSSFGTNGVGSAHAYDSAGRRRSFGVGSFGQNFSWRADGLLTGIDTLRGDTSYGYDTAGWLTNRMAEARNTKILSRDGAGRPLSVETKVNTITKLTETLAYTGDGLIASHALDRSDYLDSRAYSYANQSRRLTQEKLAIDGSTSWTNVFAYDSGTSAGAGVLTRIAQNQTGGAEWNAHMDSHLRVDRETNNVVRRLAYGRVNMQPNFGFATLGVALDGRSMPLLSFANSDTNWPTRWQAQIELLPGTHTLTAAAVHPSKLYTNSTSVTFTNAAVDQTTLSYFSEGQLTSRVWKNSSGVTNRVQSFKWDAKGRLYAFTERDANGDGHNWTAVYDGLGRRWQTLTVPTTNSVAVTNYTKSFIQAYDPIAEFLEIGVYADGRWSWKVHGPDLNGVYGGMNGLGGWDAVVSGPDTYYPLIQDIRGNILGTVNPDNGTPIWNEARVTGYGSIAGHRPLSLGEGAPLWEAASWRGRYPELSGLYNLGARYYDPVAGRFLSPDPLGHGSDPSLYAAFNGDPVNYFDPDGRIGKSANKGISASDIWGSNSGNVNARDLFAYGAQNPNAYISGTDLASQWMIAGQMQANGTLSSPQYFNGYTDEFGRSYMTFCYSCHDPNDTLSQLKLGAAFNTVNTSIPAFLAQNALAFVPGEWFFAEAGTIATATRSATRGLPLLLAEGPKPPLLLTEGTLESRVTAAYQEFYNKAWQETVDAFNQGETVINQGQAWKTVLGQKTDAAARDMLKDYLAAEGISEGRAGQVLVNRRLYNPSGSGAYRIPDVRIPSAGLILDGTIGTKTVATPQIQDFMNWSGSRVNIVTPTVLPKP